MSRSFKHVLNILKIHLQDRYHNLHLDFTTFLIYSTQYTGGGNLLRSFRFKYVLFFYCCMQLMQSMHAQPNFNAFLETISPISSSSTRETMVAEFMNSIIPYGTPLIEGDTVHFIYWDNEVSYKPQNSNLDIRQIKLVGDFTNWGYESIIMNKIAGTKLYYYSITFELTARLEFAFIINDVYWLPDPFNPQQIHGTSSTNSVLLMPKYVPPWEIDYLTGIAHGSFENMTFHSETTDRDYPITVYLPPNYNANNIEGYPSAYFQDGQSYLTIAKARNIIDNLIANDYINPIIAVFVDPADRLKEYAFTEKNEFSLFFATELVTYIDEQYNTSNNARDRLVAGDSWGGNISALISYNYAETFANCGLQSASFWTCNYEVLNTITEGVKKNISYFSAWGSYEFDITTTNRELKNSLISMGYDLTWAEYPEGHNWTFFKSTVDDMLINFFPSPKNTPNNYSGSLPDVFDLSQNFPNPFNATTNIIFFLPQDCSAKVVIYNSLGERINTIANEFYQRGKHTVTFNGNNLASGVYYYSLITDFNVITRGMLLIK